MNGIIQIYKMDIKNKVAIVTGGSGGIGFATVQSLLKHNAKHVAIFDIETNTGHANTCIEKIEKEFGKGKVSFHVCDVTKSSEFEARYDEVVKSQKAVDILINNAGIFGDLKGNRMIDINFKGVVNCTLAAIDRMGLHKKGKGGTILNVSSIAGLIPHPAVPIYVATKHAVYGFTKSLKEHYETTGVRTLTICPGVTQTNFLKLDWRKENLPFATDNFIDDLWHCSGVVQPPENVAAAIVKMLQVAQAGDTWVSDNNEPPYALKDPPHYQDRKIPI